MRKERCPYSRGGRQSENYRARRDGPAAAASPSQRGGWPRGGGGDALICPPSRRRGPHGPGARLWSKASLWAGGTTACLLFGGSAVITPSELRLLCEMTLCFLKTHPLRPWAVPYWINDKGTHAFRAVPGDGLVPPACLLSLLRREVSPVPTSCTYHSVHWSFFS